MSDCLRCDAYEYDAKMTDLILAELGCERTECGTVNGPKAAGMIRELKEGPLADDGFPLRVQTAMAMPMQGFGAQAKEVLEVLVKEIHRLRTLVDTLRAQNTEMQDARQTASWDYQHLLQHLEEVKASRDLLQIGHDAGCTDESHLLLKQEAEQAEQEDLVITLKAKQLCQTYGWEVDGETEGWTTRALREIPALVKRLEYAEGYAAGAHESSRQLQEYLHELSRRGAVSVRDYYDVDNSCRIDQEKDAL